MADAPEEFYFSILSPEILADIGYVTSEFGFLETIIANAISGMLGAHPTMMFAVTANTQISSQIKMLRALADFRIAGHPRYYEFKQFADRIELQLAPWRNAIVHGMWRPSEDGDPLAAFLLGSRATKRIQFRNEYMNRHYLRWLGTEIGRTATQLRMLLQHMGVIEKDDPNNSPGQ